jgi:flagellar hook-basal body complex protein FliE
MTIPAIGAISSALPSMSASSVSPSTATASATSAGSGADFSSVLSKGLDALESTQNKADNLAVQAATGSLTNIHDYTIAATQASLATELATAIRTKGVDAFNQIMGMQA